MDSIGTVAAILNDNLLVLRIDAELKPDQVLTVFGRVSSAKLQELGIPQLDFPKGKVRVVSQQPEHLYVAERFRVSEKQVNALERFGVSAVPPSLMSSLITSEVVWSAALDSSQSLKVGVDTVVRIGDHVAR